MCLISRTTGETLGFLIRIETGTEAFSLSYSECRDEEFMYARFNFIIDTSFVVVLGIGLSLSRPKAGHFGLFL